MTVNNKGLEFNILGSQVRLSAQESDDNRAKAAIELVQKEVETMKMQNSRLKDTDIAVLVALKLATQKLEVEDDFQTSVGSLKQGINEALEFIEVVSPGSIQAKS
jgi:cell division protein ZapA (FtsZ GTPase activity inhibitor)